MFPENSIERVVEEVSRALAGHEEALVGLDDSIPLGKIVETLKPLLPHLLRPKRSSVYLGEVKFASGPPVREYWLSSQGNFKETWVNRDGHYRSSEVSIKDVVYYLSLPEILRAIKEAIDFKLEQRKKARVLLAEVQEGSKKLLGPEGEVKIT